MEGAVPLILMVSALTAAVLVSCQPVCFIGSEYNPQSGIPPRWFLPYKDPCECTAIRLGGMRTPASSNRKGAPHYLDELFLSEDSTEIQTYFNCSRATTFPTGRSTTYTRCSSPKPLGLEDGTIPDDHITASSHQTNWPGSDGRLNCNGAWIPQSDEKNPWIEVDLVVIKVVSGIITQSFDIYGYVKKYKASYKNQSSSDYEHMTDGNGNIKVFIGNTDGNTPVTNLFDEIVVATVVRIEPTEWYSYATLRLELLGCH
ncbi:retinoschisin-like [Patiria miniata]|uniref:F5/8 type C domain-containing protein n=1 Tax=Patiria miniata TaxID=46514 RepID=A0A914A920_PATMI|nr:retinoschisin-like [Patiria miniata]